MDKQTYFKISNEQDLPLRCPILNYCMRRAFTIYFFSDYYKHDPENNAVKALQKDGVLPKDFSEKQIDIQGESPIISKGDSFMFYRNMCPEVNLFDSDNALHFGFASVAGEYDKFKTNNRFTNNGNQHFCECSEFNKYLFDSKFTKVKRKPSVKRSPISKTLRFEIFQRDNFKCQYCGKNVSEGITLEVDHKIPHSRGGKDEFDNYTTSCKDCNLGKSNKMI